MGYESTLKALALADDRIVVLTAENRAAIRNLPEVLGERFVDTGITEQAMVGVAAGLALRGRTPVCHALATFLTMRAFEFVRTDVGIPHLPVTLVGGVPGFLSEANGPTHQAIEDVALMRGIPGMEVYCPADGDELDQMLPVILDRPHPAYIRFNARPAMVAHGAPFAPGVAETVAEGDDVAILTYGFMLEEAMAARDHLAARGQSVRVVNLRSLKPIDEGALLSAARETGLVVTLEDHFRTGGLYSILADVLLQHGLTARVLPISLEQRWFRPALLQDILYFEGFTGAQIAARILARLKARRRAAAPVA